MEDLFLISDSEFWLRITEKHTDKGGVYKIVAVRDGRRVPINRFLGTDPNGVLYIGKAACFLDRVINLKKSISPDMRGTSHICGRRYKSQPAIAKQFPYEILHTELICSEQPDKLENNLLKAYANEFGEVPPLNAH